MGFQDKPYSRYMTRAILEKAINSLAGLIQGISIDGKINAIEAQFLQQWLYEHADLATRYPFTELLPRVRPAVASGILEPEEREDIIWLCNRLDQGSYFNQVTTDLQRLQGIVGGITADRRIHEAELRGLSEWLAEHEHLKSLWPYDEIDSLVTSVLADNQISPEEEDQLQELFAQFTALHDDRTITDPLLQKNGRLVGLCAVCPQIVFPDALFCFTGDSPRFSREELKAWVRELGGDTTPRVTRKVSYLVIGAAGNPLWAYACYGRKVEQAVQLRRAGHPLVLVHENDFHDAVADAM